MGLSIEKRLTDAGYKMLGMGENNEELILAILETKDTRYLKAIPFLIYRHDLNIEFIYQKTNMKTLFSNILEITKKIFEMNNIKKYISTFSYFRGDIPPGYELKIILDFEEFNHEFELQRRLSEPPKLMIEKQKIYAERELQMSLSRLFSKKERQIIRRILDEKPISKTDYEYYSRKTKKKLSSIMNLEDFARTLYAKSPGYDETLFKLKRKLEEWLEQNSENGDVSILKFFIWGADRLSINFNKKDPNSPEDQIFNTTIKLKSIKDQDIINALHKYNEHDFR